MTDSPLRPQRGAARPSRVARRFLASLRAGTDVRRDLVRRVRDDIAAGHYENELKLSIAFDRLASELRAH